MTKKLIINKVLYAHYEIDGSILFLKIRFCPKGYTEGEMEDYCLRRIQLIEKMKFKGMAYLNIV